jgi:hypothetical protein
MEQSCPLMQLEREKALQDVQNIPWEASEEVIGEWFNVWWSSEGLTSFEKFLQSRGINVTEDAR